MSKKKRAKIICKNRDCKEFLCEADGEFLYVENLEFLPKIRRKNKNGWRPVPCPKCGLVARIYLKKSATEEKKESGRKFSIFRSRFS